MEFKPASEEHKEQFREMIEDSITHEALQRKRLSKSKREKAFGFSYRSINPSYIKNIIGFFSIITFLLGCYFRGVWFWIGSGIFLFVGLMHWPDSRHQ